MSVFDSIGDGFKKLMEKTGEANGAILRGLGKVVHIEGFTDDQLQQLPAGVTPSESWEKLSAALYEAERHALNIVDDWDNQKHVAAILEKSAQN